MLLQRLNEPAHIAFGDLSADFEPVADFIDDCRLRCSSFKKLEDARTDQVEGEHLSLPDIQDNGAIPAVCAANTF